MLLKCTKRINPKRVISSALALIVIASSIAGAVFTAPVAVFALSAGGIQSTIASIILSLLLQCGVAPVNQSYLTALNNSYGYTIESAISDGLLTETADGLIDTGLSSAIESASAYSDLGLDDIFTTLSDDVGVAAASGATNIANTAIHVGKAGTIGAFAGAVAIGVGAGVLINHVRQHIGNLIKFGLPMSKESLESIKNNIPSGYSKVYYAVIQRNATLVNSNYTFTENDVICVGYPDGNGFGSTIYARNNASSTKFRIGYDNSTIYTQGETNSATGPAFSYTSGSKLLDRKIDVMAESYADTYNVYEKWNSGLIELPKTISPDVVGDIGNQYYDGTNDDFPGLVNQIPEGQDMTPVDMDDYQDFADTANNNTENGDTGQETQGQAFDDFIDPYIVDAPTIPDEPIIPDNPVDVPTVPERPTVPDQPTIPDKPNIDQETLDKALEGATTIDLRAIFPFCIPFDLYNLLLIFDTGENRKAPHITFTFPFTDWVIDVDLAPFDPVAGILRLLELILFIIGLAVATRSLIGAGGG